MTVVACPFPARTGPPSFGANLRAHREAAGLSLRQLAKRVGRSASYLCDLELGRRVPSEALMRALLRALSNEALSDLWMARVGIVPEELTALLLAHPERWHDVRALLCAPAPVRATLTYPVDADGREVEL